MESSDRTNAYSSIGPVFSLMMPVLKVMTINNLMSLDVFESIPRNGSVSLEELASSTGTEAALLERLLRAGFCFGLFNKDPEGKYLHTPLSLELTGVGGTIFAGTYENFMPVAYFGDYFAQRGRREPDGEKASTHNPYSWFWQQEGKTSFEILAQNPKKIQNFQNMLNLAGKMWPWAGFYDFNRLADGAQSDETMLVDIGGADGTTLANLLDTYTRLKPEQCVIQERENIIALAKKNESLPKGVQLQIHDFFKPQPVKHARAYHLRLICHDWSDTMVIKILRHIVSVMAPHSKVLIAETVLSDEVSEIAQIHAMMDMTMLCIGGKERSRANFEALLDAAGLKLNAVYMASQQTNFGIVEAVLK